MENRRVCRVYDKYMYTTQRHTTHYILFMKVYLLFGSVRCVSWRVSKLKALLFRCYLLYVLLLFLGCYNVEEDFHKNAICDFTYNIVNVLYASIFLHIVRTHQQKLVPGEVTKNYESCSWNDIWTHFATDYFHSHNSKWISYLFLRTSA